MRIQSKHSDADRGLDPYFTPREAIEALISIERDSIPDQIWEPACGDGAIVTPLREAGYLVRGTDIANYGFNCDQLDYFKTKPYPGTTGIITNPPFNLAVEFAQKALTEVSYLALLLRTNFLESNERLSFFRTTPPQRVWISSRRLPMMHRHGWEGPRAPSNTCYAWFVWDGASAKQQGPILKWFDWAEIYKSPAPIWENLL